MARADVTAAADPVPAVAGLVDDLSRQAGLVPGSARLVQLGLPGSYDAAAGVIRHIDVPGWDRPGLVDDLATRLGATVAADNDVNLAAIAERHHGVAGAVESFALMWFSGGLGLAIDLGGTLLRGARGGAGEIGYVPVGLGRGADRTDLTDLAGGPAVLALAAEHGIDAATPEAAVAAGTPPFLDALAERIAYGLAAVAAVLDPPLIVLAGDVGRAAATRSPTGSPPRCGPVPHWTPRSPPPVSPRTRCSSALRWPPSTRSANRSSLPSGTPRPPHRPPPRPDPTASPHPPDHPPEGVLNHALIEPKNTHK
ncbi:ROK family protein [Phytohabitans flavus]|uniref:ROK family protein n=1 Tax=Phytohabitans flavus TaxID=1076124 RepID=UPI00363F83F4